MTDEAVAAQNAVAAASSEPVKNTEQELAEKTESLLETGAHELSFLEEDLIKAFHWITVDETKKILAWIAARTQKKNQPSVVSSAESPPN